MELFITLDHHILDFSNLKQKEKKKTLFSLKNGTLEKIYRIGSANNKSHKNNYINSSNFEMISYFRITSKKAVE